MSGQSGGSRGAVRDVQHQQASFHPYARTDQQQQQQQQHQQQQRHHQPSRASYMANSATVPHYSPQPSLSMSQQQPALPQHQYPSYAAPYHHPMQQPSVPVQGVYYDDGRSHRGYPRQPLMGGGGGASGGGNSNGGPASPLTHRASPSSIPSTSKIHHHPSMSPSVPVAHAPPAPHFGHHGATEGTVSSPTLNPSATANVLDHLVKSAKPKPVYHPRATMIIIGMKGAGKTTLGIIAHRMLARSFIDTDQHFMQKERTSVESYIASMGWEKFRERETSILKEVLARHPFDAVIACGGGIVESAEARRALEEVRDKNPVIQILREEDAIQRHVDGRFIRQYKEDLDTMIKRRAVYYRECSSHTFYNLTCQDEQKPSKAEENGANDHPTFATSSRPVTGGASPPHPLKFKKAGDSFMRLLHYIFGDTRKTAAKLLKDHRSADPASSAPIGVPPTPATLASMSTQARNSISHLLASHGPGPDVAVDRRQSTIRPIDSPPILQTSSSSSSAITPLAVLPRRANVLNRSSLLTRRTTAVSLTFPDLTKVDPLMIRQITQGVDALEVRVDILECMKHSRVEARRQSEVEPFIDYEEVARQIETLRRVVPNVPILFTLRSDREGGFFHDDRKIPDLGTKSRHSQRIYYSLLRLAIGMGVEMLDVELGWDSAKTIELRQHCGLTRLVTSYHDLNGALKWDSMVPDRMYERACELLGRCVHIVMIIGTANRAFLEQNNYMNAFAVRKISQAAANPERLLPPLMAINMGPAGRSSRLFNDVLNFVSHPAMSIKAGPGQFSLKELMETLVRLRIIQRSQFHLYGSVEEEAKVTRNVIQTAFDMFGLPYKVINKGTWSLSEYIDVHQRTDAFDRESEREWLPESGSDGLFIVGQAHLQNELYSIMQERSPQKLSLLARVVQSVDILARQDMGLALLGTERGRHAASSLGELRGPLIGCHSLPASIFRLLSSNLAPINAPNVNRSALLVVLDDANHEEKDAQANTTIAKRAAVYALAKLGFGTIYIVDEATHNAAAHSHESRRASTTPTGSRDTSQPPPQSLDTTWCDDVLQLAYMVSSPNGGASGPEGGEAGSPFFDKFPTDVQLYIRPVVKHITLRSLAYPFSAFIAPSQRSGSVDATAEETAAAKEDKMDTDDAAPPTNAIRESARHSSKRPCAIVIVGGTASQQETVMHHLSTLTSNPTTESNSRSATPSAEPAASPFMLPKDFWDSSFGGAIVRVPSIRDAPMGLVEKGKGCRGHGHPQFPGTLLESSGWIRVAPWLMDRDRVQRTVIEAWTRRSAPKQDMLSVWEGQGDEKEE